jgi:hypothetical protein
MVKYVLFIMFFTAPPAAPGKQVWQFSSSTQLGEFTSMDNCIRFGKHLQDQIGKTTTTTMRGWCVEDHTGESTQAPVFGEPTRKSPWQDVPAIPGR